jgi:hypothetical protein
VDQLKGKFRSFLLASLQNFLSNQARRACRLKRGGQVEFVYLDLKSAEDRYAQKEPVEDLTPEKIFDARWAMALLGEAKNRLRQESVVGGKAKIFEALKAFSDPFNTENLPSYEEAAHRLEMSVAAVKTLITGSGNAALHCYERKSSGRFQTLTISRQKFTSFVKLWSQPRDGLCLESGL